MKTTTIFSMEILQEANRPAKRLATICMIAGTFFTAFWMFDIFLWVAYGWGILGESDGRLVLFLGLFGLIFGVMLVCNIRKSYKAYDGDGKVSEYEFTAEYMTIHSTRDGETLADVKHRYDEIVKMRETEKYFFVFINEITLYPVDKAGLLPEEQVALREYLQAGIKCRKERIKRKK